MPSYPFDRYDPRHMRCRFSARTNTDRWRLTVHPGKTPVTPRGDDNEGVGPGKKFPVGKAVIRAELNT